MEIKLILSGDGSHTLFVPSLNENYHSTHGALTESMHVYINNGLNSISKTSITVLEIGFGSGLNALLTWINASGKNIHYITVEKYPLPYDIWQKLNHANHLGPDAAMFFNQLHLSKWGEPLTIAPNFTLHKIEGDFREVEIPMPVDLVYFDAFGPDKQPDLWQTPVFEKIAAKMTDHAVFVTYCAKGQVRRDLQQVGLATERLPGPPKKREMLRATKHNSTLL